MKCTFASSGLALSVALLAGCAAQTKIVSTDTLPLYQSADATSPVVSTLKYGDAVTLKATLRVAPPFAGDRSLFPEDLIPGWSQVSVAEKVGYVPDSALVSEYLFEKQVPDKVISESGKMVAINGFTNNSAKPRLRAMSGAVGTNTVAEIEVDIGKARAILDGYKADAGLDIPAFLKAGGLAAKPVAATVTGDGSASLSDSLRQSVASGVGLVGSAAQDSAVSGAAETAAGFVYSEIGPVQEFQTGFFVAGCVVNQYKPVPRTDARSRYLEQVGRSLAAASNAPVPLHGQTIVLMSSDEPNAFAVPGGFVFVTTGMLDFLRDEDELAAILAHEMGHLELQHGMKAVGQDKVLSLFNIIEQCDKALQTNDPLLDELKAKAKELCNEVIGEMTDKVRNGYSRELESQADWRSLQLCDRLGYDTTALYEVLERFKATNGSYGGAAYPQERGADVLKYRQQLGLGTADAAARQVRAKRYRQAVGR